MEDEANARLIAAAPDMADLLPSLLELARKSPAYSTSGEHWAVEAIMKTRAILATIDGDDDAKDNAAMMDQINAV